jgi:hypothetical protein
MDHEAYENEMMDAVNRHKEEADTKSEAKWSMVMTKNDARVVARGLKRTLIALLNAATFALAVLCFITVAKVKGYWAVMMFFVALLNLAVSFILLYAQGIIHVESKGDGK